MPLFDYVCAHCGHAFECLNGQDYEDCEKCKAQARRITVQRPGYRRDRTWDE